MSAHTCRDGLAHRFLPDPSGVWICSCGEIEMSPEDEMGMVEMLTEPPLPAERARRLYGKVYDALYRHGAPLTEDREDFVERLVDGVERPEE